MYWVNWASVWTRVRYLDIFNWLYQNPHVLKNVLWSQTAWSLIFDPFCVLRHFYLWATKRFHKKRRNANQRSQCSGHNGQQPQVAPVKVRVHPAVAILLAVGRGLTRPPQKNTQKKVSLFESWKLFMLVCKVKMLGEKKKKNNLLKIWSFPV